MNYEDIIKHQKSGYAPIPGRRVKFSEPRPLSTIEHVAAIRDDYARRVFVRLLGGVIATNLAAAHHP